jgi:sugar phosphate isomerase/epimerase
MPRTPILALLLLLLAASAPAADRDDSAAEALGWRLALKGYTLAMFPVFEQLDIIHGLGVKYYELNLGQDLRAGDKEKKLKGVGPDMAAEDLAAFKAKLASCGIKLVSCGIVHHPEDEKEPDPAKREAKLRKLFAFLKDLGDENLGIESKPTDLLVKVATEYGIKIAIHNHPDSYPPEQVLAETAGLPDTFGACADVGHYGRRGISAPAALRTLGKRIIQLHLKDVDAKKVDTPFGKGIVDIKGCLAALKELSFKGVLTIEYDVKPKDPDKARAEFVPQLAEDVAFFDQCARELSAK